ncbi:MAG: indolepyruvate ferredoxin oxidoreductase subunit alpha [Candidatus Aminicenantes bacterium]|nr:indolepyruvate ferredoxin oxidoreductase subunit alpha [Candidatus Aminicenantes bacterium]
MSQHILLGDEAVALGAVHAGLTGAYSYPGTPASEIMEFLIRFREKKGGFNAFWCVNEKVAFEEALGVSFAGRRAMVSMKHVGLNVAADPFMNAAMTGANGGLVVVSADDPGMHSSQNEQDSRYYAQFAQIFCYEPSNHQEAYQMARESFDISEEVGLPVMIRMVTRLSHSRSGVTSASAREQNPLKRGEWTDWTLLPVNARKRLKILNDMQPKMVALSEKSRFNALRFNGTKSRMGIIASGLGYNYVLENFTNPDEVPPLLKISSYPLPIALVGKLLDEVDEILVVEEGYPFIEKNLGGLFGMKDKNIRGKLSGHLPLTGELSADSVRQALGLTPRPHAVLKDFKPAARPPQLCLGCPHADTFKALNQVLEDYPGSVVFSDIGCYTLGALPPYSAIDTCVCMGASVSMAKGGSDSGIYPAVATIGDSTFAHSGMTPLLDAAAADTNMTVIIADNAAVAMTGGQPTFATGDKLFEIVKGLGVPEEHIRVIIPLPKNAEENKKIMKEEISHKGLSVIIASRECIQETRKRKRSK